MNLKCCIIEDEDIYCNELKTLRDKNYAGEIVFLTSFHKYVFEGYPVEAMNYLVKPPPKNFPLHGAPDTKTCRPLFYFPPEKQYFAAPL